MCRRGNLRKYSLLYNPYAPAPYTGQSTAIRQQIRRNKPVTSMRARRQGYVGLLVGWLVWIFLDSLLLEAVLSDSLRRILYLPPLPISSCVPGRILVYVCSLSFGGRGESGRKKRRRRCKTVSISVGETRKRQTNKEGRTLTSS